MKEYSVLIPAYNVEKYISECIESILCQSGMQPDLLSDTVEIIIADDGSTDTTGEICDKYAEEYSYINVYHKKNEGLLLTRQFLAQKASGKYIIYLDADDKWEADLLKTLDAYIVQYNNPDIISFGYNLWEGERYLPYEKVNAQLYCDAATKETAWLLLLCEDTYNAVWSKTIKREVLLKSKPQKSLEQIRRGEDKLLAISLFEASKCILFISEQLYNYRVDNSSMTRVFKPEYFDEIITVDQFALEKLREHTSYDKMYLVRWGENFIGKFIDYIVSAFSSLQSNEAKKYINNYACKETVKKAVSYARKSKSPKTKIKAYLLSLKWYGLLRFVYGR